MTSQRKQTQRLSRLFQKLIVTVHVYDTCNVDPIHEWGACGSFSSLREINAYLSLVLMHSVWQEKYLGLSTPVCLNRVSKFTSSRTRIGAWTVETCFQIIVTAFLCSYSFCKRWILCLDTVIVVNKKLVWNVLIDYITLIFSVRRVARW